MEMMEYGVEDEEDSVPSLLEYMPADVLVEIFKFVDWDDLCQLSQTCRKFREICSSATLWLALDTLDFRHCGIPDEKKILKVLQRTPNAKHLYLGDVITADSVRPVDHDMEEEEDEGQEEDPISPADKFVLNILRACPRLESVDLDMHDISDRTVEAICAKCVYIQKMAIHRNDRISHHAIKDLVSLNTSLTDLCIDRCGVLHFLSLQHTEPNQTLALTRVSLLGLGIVAEQIEKLIRSCPSLTHLDLSGSIHLERFGIEQQQQQQPARSGLDNLVELTLEGCADLQLISLPYCPRLQILNMCHCYRLTEITGTTNQLRTVQTRGCESLVRIGLASSTIESLCCTDMPDLNSLLIGSPHLHTLDVSRCTRLTAAQVLGAIIDIGSLMRLDICGCKGIPPEDVNDVILPQLINLKSLKYGGHSWNKVHLTSKQLTAMEYSDCINTCGVVLNMPQLEQLKLNGCRDFTEQDIIDSLLYGRQINRMQGLDSLIDTAVKEKPFADGTGTPSLSCVRFHNLPGLHGELLSHWMRHFTKLTSVELVHCTFLSHLTVDGWSQLKNLKIESCNRLNNLEVKNVPNLAALVVRWCSMVQTLYIQGAVLSTLDTTGTNSAAVNITCDKLQQLHISGICTQPGHTLKLGCKQLEKLTIEKCDRLSDEVLANIIQTSPNLKSLCLLGSFSIKEIRLPVRIEACSLTGLRAIRALTIESPVNVKHLTLNNLPKLIPLERQHILSQCQDTLKVLEVRAIPGETTLKLCLRSLQSLTLDQGIHLQTLEINCPRMQNLRIQGCPRLLSLVLHVDSLAQVQVYHSMPLLALRNLSLHCSRATYLPTVLHFYCPNLNSLDLYHCVLKSTQLYGLGHNLKNLQCINLHSCTVKHLDNPGTSLSINSSLIGRDSKQNMVVNFIS